MPSAAPSPPNAVTGADGSFTVAGLAAGSYDVTASHDGFSPKTASALPAPAKQPTGWPPIVLSGGVAVSGVVHDDQGAPIVGATVTLLGEGAEPSPTATDGTGAFRVSNLAKGRPLMLTAAAPGFAFSSRSVTPPAEGVTIVLGKTGTIRGRVVDGSTGTPIAAFSVGATPAARGRRGFGGGGAGAGAAGFGGGAPAQAQYAEDGSFELSVAPGSWDVRAVADGYRPADVSNIDLDAGETKEGVEISLKRGGGLTGHVVDNRGSPVSRRQRRLLQRRRRRKRGGPGGGLGAAATGPTATTDGDGHFQLDGLPDGHVILTRHQHRLRSDLARRRSRLDAGHHAHGLLGRRDHGDGRVLRLELADSRAPPSASFPRATPERPGAPRRAPSRTAAAASTSTTSPRAATG